MSRRVWTFRRVFVDYGGLCGKVGEGEGAGCRIVRRSVRGSVSDAVCAARGEPVGDDVGPLLNWVEMGKRRGVPDIDGLSAGLRMEKWEKKR
jgi:hypothetical protein